MREAGALMLACGVALFVGFILVVVWMTLDVGEPSIAPQIIFNSFAVTLAIAIAAFLFAPWLLLASGILIAGRKLLTRLGRWTPLHAALLGVVAGVPALIAIYFWVWPLNWFVAATGEGLRSNPALLLAPVVGGAAGGWIYGVVQRRL